MANVTINTSNSQATPTKEAVEKAINESHTLVEALESVAAMYQIPASNIIVDDRAKQISVTGDSIITPDRPNPSANTKAIVCAIGAVLDNISQRIDQKLNVYQSEIIEKNKALENQKQPDPSKGEVIGRFTASDGSEIIAYSSGLVDMDNTHAANEKVRELRATKQIPDIISEPNKPVQTNSYFSDEEADIMQGVKTNDDIKMDIDKQVHDISAKIGESAYFMDLIDQFDGTTTLGYDLLKSQGFDFVQPTQGMIQESNVGSAQPSVSDLKHMRFDNKNLMKAVELFNAARLSFMDTEPSLKDICRNDKFKQAIKCIEQQFDCHLAIRFYDAKDSKGKEVTDGYTSIFNDVTQPITVSKAKGFQLHGTPIDIDFAGKIFQINPAGKNRELFGQSVLAVILHEIWHNISGSLRKDNDEFIFTLSSGMALATSTDNMKNRRVILSNCVNALSSINGKKLNVISKRKLVKRLMSIAAMRYDGSQLKEAAATPEELENVDKYIKKMEDYVNKHDPSKKKGKGVKRVIKTIAASVMFVGGVILMACNSMIWPLGIALILGSGGLATANGFSNAYADELKRWLSITDKEEYYADLFSAMYGLPNVFGVGDVMKGITANKLDHARLQKLTTLEREIGKLMFDPHPSSEERSYAAMTVAKKFLDSGEKLDPAVKKYCEWIIANYSSLEDTDVKEVFASNIFDPKEAEDLDKHLQDIVTNNNITVTESAKS